MYACMLVMQACWSCQSCGQCSDDGFLHSHTAAGRPSSPWAVCAPTVCYATTAPPPPLCRHPAPCTLPYRTSAYSTQPDYTTQRTKRRRVARRRTVPHLLPPHLPPHTRPLPTPAQPPPYHLSTTTAPHPTQHHHTVSPLRLACPSSPPTCCTAAPPCIPPTHPHPTPTPNAHL